MVRHSTQYTWTVLGTLACWFISVVLIFLARYANTHTAITAVLMIHTLLLMTSIILVVKDDCDVILNPNFGKYSFACIMAIAAYFPFLVRSGKNAGELLPSRLPAYWVNSLEFAGPVFAWIAYITMLFVVFAMIATAIRVKQRGNRC